MAKKILRGMYMVAAFAILLPLILIIEALWFTYCTVITGNPIKAMLIWYEYLRTGIMMNVDFIQNGF